MAAAASPGVPRPGPPAAQQACPHTHLPYVPPPVVGHADALCVGPALFRDPSSASGWRDVAVVVTYDNLLLYPATAAAGGGVLPPPALYQVATQQVTEVVWQLLPGKRQRVLLSAPAEGTAVLLEGAYDGGRLINVFNCVLTHRQCGGVRNALPNEDLLSLARLPGGGGAAPLAAAAGNVGVREARGVSPARRAPSPAAAGAAAAAAPAPQAAAAAPRQRLQQPLPQAAAAAAAAAAAWSQAAQPQAPPQQHRQPQPQPQADKHAASSAHYGRRVAKMHGAASSQQQRPQPHKVAERRQGAAEASAGRHASSPAVPPDLWPSSP